MIEGDDLRLDLQGDALILRARHIARWVGAPLVGFALYLIWRIYGIGIPNQSWLALLAYWFGLVLGVMFFGIGVFLLQPREVITTFDLRSHRVVHHLSIGRGWYERRRTYAFAEIADLRLNGYDAQPDPRARDPRWRAHHHHQPHQSDSGAARHSSQFEI